MASLMQTYSLRVKPSEDIVTTLEDFIKLHDLRAACIITAVGSLKSATLRMANSSSIETFTGFFEIVSLVGTLGRAGTRHLHLSLSREDGSTIGGHVIGDLIVYTTAEIIIGESTSLIYNREFDDETGFDELVIKER